MQEWQEETLGVNSQAWKLLKEEEEEEEDNQS
jgi:hypothetical protein